jgi:hypothetical protein
MKTIFLMTLLSTLLAACATIHSGKGGHSMADTPKMPIKISGRTIGEPNGDAFQLMEVTIENTSDEWLRISHSEVLIKDPEVSKLSVVVDSDLKSWAAAYQAREEMEKTNRDLLNAGLILGGITATAIGYNRGDEGIVNAGSFVSSWGYASVAWDALKGTYAKGQGVDHVPESHLYAPMAIPPKMFLRRWVLINKPAKITLGILAIRLENAAGEKESYAISIH